MQLTGKCSLEQILPSGTVLLHLVGFHHISPLDECARSLPVYLAHSVSPTAQADPVSSHHELSAREEASIKSVLLHLCDCTCILIMQ